MTKVLHINSSLFGNQGESSQLATQFVEKLVAGQKGSQVKNRILADDTVPHLNAETFQGFMLDVSEQNDQQKAMTALSNTLIDEVKEADVLVLGVPLYNFTMPSTLKSWFDFIARAGITFRYTENGPVGLLENKKAYVFAARGGLYQGTEMDTQTPLIRHFLAFIGITDVEFIYAEGLSMGGDARESALQNASQHIDQLVA
ncbi:FMN-dependent NADH-azoreductase [Endozoicomonas sp. OPT23]|uniref:FMN-dependent NADH-azoreductase n=1 Tax=Endozoicomonas sp. OPT23 TaxID=2072845 RepID=UPI00129B95FF|nr:NAD(P)H-dependent oxidoreductase [Endozoicomonas sp. OPT23]MRI32509.1 FMN-dependent NADH-azoreductase [Endozoicomonas sp. OPT23]